MIEIKKHGRKWIMALAKVETNSCPECGTESLYVTKNSPQKNKTEYWFDSTCDNCGCEWTITYEKEIGHID